MEPLIKAWWTVGEPDQRHFVLGGPLCVCGGESASFLWSFVGGGRPSQHRSCGPLESEAKSAVRRRRNLQNGSSWKRPCVKINPEKQFLRVKLGSYQASPQGTHFRDRDLQLLQLEWLELRPLVLWRCHRGSYDSCNNHAANILVPLRSGT